jgi:3-oxoacyl-[acyl-carrier protein] reductase
LLQIAVELFKFAHKIKDMHAIVSGATKGIGKAVSLALAKAGYNLALGARNLVELEALKKEIETDYQVKVLVKSVDFSSRFEVVNFAETVMNAWGAVTVIVNNVGGYTMGKIDEEEEGTLDKMLKINLWSAYYLTLPFLEGMRKQKTGHIFNICSIVAKQPRKEAPSYTIAKYALKGLSDVLREDMREHQVKVTTIYPGSVSTASWDGIDAPIDTFVQPSDIANAVLTALQFSSGALLEELVVTPLDTNY